MSSVTVRNRNQGKLDKNGKLKKPNWEYRFEAAKVSGKRTQVSKSGFRTKADALNAGNKALMQYDCTGTHFEPSDISVSDFLDYWFDNYCKIELKYNTQIAYLSQIENHLKPAFGNYKLKSLSPALLTQFANQLKLNGLSKSHLEGILSTLSTALDYAVEPLRYIKDNPMRYVKTPKVDKKSKERIILSYEEYQKILDTFPERNRFHIPLLIGWNCGLRISETMGLTWDDIDLEEKTITVNKQTAKRNYGVDVRNVLLKKGKKEEKSSWYFTSPKYNSSRTIKMPESLVLALRQEKVRQMKNELEYGEYYTIHVTKEEKDEKGNTISRIIPVEKSIHPQLPRVRMVCISENGEMTTSDSMKYCNRVIHNQLKIAFDYHCLRHTHATLLIENGVSPKLVQMRLGHKNITTTLQTYVKATDNMETAAIDIFEKAVNGNLPT